MIILKVLIKLESAMNSISRMIKEAEQLVAKMTLEEKASLCSGKDFWTSKPVERLGVRSFMLTDGPHGLRKQKGEADHLGLNESVPSTCFPTAVTTACAFDTELMNEIGVALAEECLENEVGVLLGPAINIKRSPLCGRNFEYVSEDPLLAGETAAALIAGIQSKNVGVSVKHYLANNQEKRRMVSDSIIDSRALREVYLRAFEIAIKKSQPWTLMCSYNKINGTYASDNKYFMSDIPRGEWGYEGAIVTDWGAMNDRVEAIKAGLDLEMPSCCGLRDTQIVKAVQAGELDEADVDKCVARMTAIALMTAENKKASFDKEAHDILARRAARESAVLLKNDGILPVSKSAKVAVIGEFAAKPRYQGAGSSKINPIKITSVCDEFKKQNINFIYSQGYDVASDKIDEEKLKIAVETAKKADIVFAFVGLPDSYESEGFDRKHMRLPESHIRLIEELHKINDNVVAVLYAGSVVEMDWLDKVRGLLLVGLSGQNNGGVCYDLLFGDFSPCGKLAESYPFKVSDNPSNKYFAMDTYVVQYRESIYVGYRYYDKAGKNVQFPFGYGLSYSTFEVKDLTLSTNTIDDTEKVVISAIVTNSGTMAAKQVVQLYVAPPVSKIFKPIRELRAYKKIDLKAGESKEIIFELDKSAFAYWNVNINDWHAESGIYTIEIGNSSRDIVISTQIQVKSTIKAEVPNYSKSAPAYYLLKDEELNIPKDDFEKILGQAVPSEPTEKPFTINSSIGQIRACKLGRLVAYFAKKGTTKALGDVEEIQPMIDAMLYDMPIRALIMGTNGAISLKQLDGFVDMLNGKYWTGLKKLASKKNK